MPRGHYKNICQVDRERIINAYQNNQDWRNVANLLDIKVQSARNLIIKFIQTGETEKQNRGGVRRRKIDEEMVNFMTNLIEQKPTITLKEINAQLRIHLPGKPYVSHQALSLKLDGLLYTIKDLRTIPIQWNTPERKLERREYADWLLGEGLNKHKVFIDEFGINLWTARTKGRALRGLRAVNIVNGQLGKNLTIVLAVSSDIGLVHSSCISGGITKELFSDFLIETAELVNFHNADSVFILDNARAHGDLPNLGDQHQTRFLPKYSPFLNQCEMAGSCVKSAVKRRINDPDIRVEIRLRILKREVQQSLVEITPPKCQQWFNHTMTYVPLCLREEDIFQ